MAKQKKSTPVNETLLLNIREALMNREHVVEKSMFGGICFMVNDKMCICVRGDHMMCRVGPEDYETYLEERGCEPMVHGGRLMKGYIYVYEEGYKRATDFRKWIHRALAYNDKL
ncbi:hypothetical protein GCM10023231_23930 [Olivibacter ginsenosidimutans]|uniref:TfoX N-terminal domain-containing protein n=1 Tax=Olivibacter ginsenosidimutans TaxID=1176537 RepID=A0ABP9BJ90_9SPHI